MARRFGEGSAADPTSRTCWEARSSFVWWTDSAATGATSRSCGCSVMAAAASTSLSASEEEVRSIWASSSCIISSSSSLSSSIVTELPEQGQSSFRRSLLEARSRLNAGTEHAPDSALAFRPCCQVRVPPQRDRARDTSAWSLRSAWAWAAVMTPCMRAAALE
eukprot:6209877-Pleurochrysis_carterae.AAC.1